MSDQTLFNWVKASRQGTLKGADRTPVSAEQMEISRLRAELARVKMERDILGKATVGSIEPTIAFSFIRRLLNLNDLCLDPVNDPLVEVILLSRNDPDTGMRVMNSIAHHDLGITRAVFMQGKSPYEFIPALNISLFLSGNAVDVRDAIEANFPAGQVLDSAIVDDDDDNGLRIAFDFDGVLANDESESVMQETRDLAKFHEHEVKNMMQPHDPGPLQQFLIRIANIQKVEEQKRKTDDSYQNRLRVSLVTARNAPSHERALNTLKSWGVMPKGVSRILCKRV